MQDVFISYSRKDSVFVKSLAEALEKNGRNVWVDFEDIPFATDWWQEICGGIDGSDTVLFIISPDSLTSQVCSLEMNYAIQNNKRLIPLLYRDVKDIEIPKPIASLNWILFNTSDFDSAMQKLVQTLDTDVAATRAHTQLLVRANEWDNKGRNISLLLRGEALQEMLPLRTHANLTDVQLEYLEASQLRERRSTLINRFWLGFLGGTMGVGYYAFWSFRGDTIFFIQRIGNMFSAGEVFGFFIGLQSAIAFALPVRILHRAAKRVGWGEGEWAEVIFRILICYFCAVAAWVSYQWFYLLFVPVIDSSIILGGAGLSAGFILRILFPRTPVWLAFIVTAVTAFIPIYTLNNLVLFSETRAPLIYFDEFDQIWRTALPMCVIIALGANASELWRQAKKLYAMVRKNV